MKLFQRLLVAPAALGLLAPIAANAAELNINGVSDYSASSEEVKSISQFSDVYPTDWAYQALTNLAERHGCAVASPTGSITRYEAAALLNTCLSEVAQVNEEERRLISEFAPELAVIKGRIDGLEARIGEFEAGQFSTTTKLTGKTYFVLGAVTTDKDGGEDEATTLNYTTQLNLNTSFSGRDLLYTRIKTGNFVKGETFSNKKTNTYLAASNQNDNGLKVDKIWYQFPVGDNLTFWVGPRIENYYMLASAPSIYKPVLKAFALGGNGATYGSSTDGGFGAAWTQSVDDRTQPRFAVSTNYVSKGATKADNEISAKDGAGGLLTNAQSKWLSKVEYGSNRWQVSGAVSVNHCSKVDGSDSCKVWTDYYSTEKGKSRTGDTTAYALRAYWMPEETGAIPAIQLGYDVASVDDDGVTGSTEETSQWMIGLMWKDAFIDGNRAGVAFGARQYATDIVGGADDPADDNFVWEAYYDIKVSDNITVTPAIFGGTDTYNGASDNSDDVFGGLVQTTFKF